MTQDATTPDPGGVDPRRLRELLTLHDHPRSAGYDPRWMVDNCMGPNPLWLLEDLAEHLDLQRGMRVLDLGCGRAMTSIFLAREFDVRVWAADLWVPPTENWRRVVDAGLESSIVPLHAEANDLPFAHAFFDAVVSVDSYHYFGTEDLYIGYITKFIRPGGQLGIAVPGVVAEVEAVPEHLQRFWEWEFLTFHSPGWWRNRWELSGQVQVEVATSQRDAWRLWKRWSEACLIASDNEFIRESSARDVDMLELDAGRTITFDLVVARVPTSPPDPVDV